MPPFSIDDLIARLAEFGEADEIAAQFAILRILGDPDSGQTCPIANLITGACHPEYNEDVSVHCDEISFDDEVRKTPPVASTFIKRFDSWGYPELIEERR